MFFSIPHPATIFGSIPPSRPANPARLESQFSAKHIKHPHPVVNFKTIPHDDFNKRVYALVLSRGASEGEVAIYTIYKLSQTGKTSRIHYKKEHRKTTRNRLISSNTKDIAQNRHSYTFAVLQWQPFMFKT